MNPPSLEIRWDQAHALYPVLIQLNPKMLDPALSDLLTELEQFLDKESEEEDEVSLSSTGDVQRILKLRKFEVQTSKT